MPWLPYGMLTSPILGIEVKQPLYVLLFTFSFSSLIFSIHIFPFLFHLCLSTYLISFLFFFFIFFFPSLIFSSLYSPYFFIFFLYLLLHLFPPFFLIFSSALPFLTNTQVFLWYPIIAVTLLWTVSMILLVFGIHFSLSRFIMVLHYT